MADGGDGGGRQWHVLVWPLPYPVRVEQRIHPFVEYFVPVSSLHKVLVLVAPQRHARHHLRSTETTMGTTLTRMGPEAHCYRLPAPQVSAPCFPA